MRRSCGITYSRHCGEIARRFAPVIMPPPWNSTFRPGTPRAASTSGAAA
jgi:hypothetical protein